MVCRWAMHAANAMGQIKFSVDRPIMQSLFPHLQSMTGMSHPQRSWSNQWKSRVGQWLHDVIPDEAIDGPQARYFRARQVQALRSLSAKTVGQRCTVDPVATERLVQQQSAQRAALPPLPNEKLVYTCRRAG